MSYSKSLQFCKNICLVKFFSGKFIQKIFIDNHFLPQQTILQSNLSKLFCTFFNEKEIILIWCNISFCSKLQILRDIIEVVWKIKCANLSKSGIPRSNWFWIQKSKLFRISTRFISLAQKKTNSIFLIFFRLSLMKTNPNHSESNILPTLEP